jgi:hypothetical protein
MYQYLIPGMQGDPASFIVNTTLTLGSLDKPLDARTHVTVSYASVIPADTVANYAFKVKPGGDPQLWIDTAALDATKTILTFYVSEGLAGQAYDLAVIAKLASGNVRSDVLTVNVLGDDCGCCSVPMPISQINNVSGDGGMFVNAAPRFFVSNTTPVGANVLDRWYETATGDIYDFVTNGLTSWWEKSTVGGGGGYGALAVKMQPIAPNGVTTNFTMVATDGTTVNVPNANPLLVSVDGVWQEAVAQFEASGNQISFAQPPSADSNVFILWLSPPPVTPSTLGPRR